LQAGQTELPGQQPTNPLSPDKEIIMFKTLIALALAAAFNVAAQAAPVTSLPSLSVAKHGADDGKGGHGKGHPADVQVAKHGADDGKGGHGKGHPADVQVAKHGADDGKGGHGKGHPADVQVA
jgi:uncharacterized low-complexity protein